jgi:hypothetical protein
MYSTKMRQIGTVASLTIALLVGLVSNAEAAPPPGVHFGTVGDIPVPGHYLPDSIKSDFAVWRPSSGEWWVMNSTTLAWGMRQKLGGPGDTPVPGDYDGDGRTDFAVWHPATTTLTVVSSGTGIWTTHQLGNPVDQAGDVPVPGDYDGDGRTDFALWRPASGSWLVVNSSTHTLTTRQWGSGSAGDIPVPGDYNGDGRADFAVWRQTTGYWYITELASSGLPTYTTIQWGTPGDLPAQARYNCVHASPAVFRPSTGEWWIYGAATVSLGAPGDVPVPANYLGDDGADEAVFRPGTGNWLVSQSHGICTE